MLKSSLETPKALISEDDKVRSAAMRTQLLEGPEDIYLYA